MEFKPNFASSFVTYHSSYFYSSTQLTSSRSSPWSTLHPQTPLSWDSHLANPLSNNNNNPGEPPLTHTWCVCCRWSRTWSWRSWRWVCSSCRQRGSCKRRRRSVRSCRHSSIPSGGRDSCQSGRGTQLLIRCVLRWINWSSSSYRRSLTVPRSRLSCRKRRIGLLYSRNRSKTKRKRIWWWLWVKGVRWHNNRLPKRVPLTFLKLLDLNSKNNVAGNRQLDPTDCKKKKRDTKGMALFPHVDNNNFKLATTIWTNSS